MEFEFIADHPVLDFVATVAARGTLDEDKLASPKDLAAWITQSQLLDRPPALTSEDLKRAVAVREATFALIAATIDGTRLRPADRSLLTTTANGPMPTLALGADGLRRTGDLDAALTMLARDALELCAGPDRELLRWCADGTCTRPFVDRSRGSRRRWCGMKGCGDRAKAAAYRQRHRQASGG